MVTTITDPTIRDWLATIPGETDLCDADGRVLGHFVPADRDLEALYAEAAAHFDPEELRRRKNSGEPAYPLSELWRRLETSESA